MENLAGKTLGKYEIKQLLGRGGMAEVYKAYHPQLGRFVALKVLHAHLMEAVGFRERFGREARNVAALTHPNIVQVYDFDREGDSYFMVMEFIEGPTLKGYMETLHNQSQRLPMGKVIEIVQKIGEALAYAHEQGMIHRDVKPANVMVGKGGRIVLTDFGIAKLVAGPQHTATGTMMGTPAYMSPEIARGDHGDARADIYSLGVMLYELATGKLPYEGDTPMAVVLKHISAPLPTPSLDNPNIPAKLEAIILRALAKDPANRYQTTAEMLAELAKVEISRPASQQASIQIGAKDQTLPPLDALSAAVEQQLSAETRPAQRAEATALKKAGAAQPAPRAAIPWRRVGGLALVGGAILALIGFGDSSLFGFASPQPRPTAARILFQDDFSDPTSGWDRLVDAEGFTDYEDGHYRIRVDLADSNFYVYPGRTFEDVAVEVEATMVGGENENTLGIVCGQEDSDNLFFLVITSDGQFLLGQLENGAPAYLGMPGLESNPAILTGKTTNHLRAECANQQLTLYANGALLGSAKTTRPIRGQVGLTAGTFEIPGTDILFDNFVVSEP